MRGNQGWSTAGRAGRPKLKSPEESKARKMRSLRASDEEWELIKEFAKLAKDDIREVTKMVKANK